MTFGQLVVTSNASWLNKVTNKDSGRCSRRTRSSKIQAVVHIERGLMQCGRCSSRSAVKGLLQSYRPAYGYGPLSTSDAAIRAVVHVGRGHEFALGVALTICILQLNLGSNGKHCRCSPSPPFARARVPYGRQREPSATPTDPQGSLQQLRLATAPEGRFPRGTPGCAKNHTVLQVISRRRSSTTFLAPTLLTPTQWLPLRSQRRRLRFPLC